MLGLFEMSVVELGNEAGPPAAERSTTTYYDQSPYFVTPDGKSFWQETIDSTKDTIMRRQWLKNYSSGERILAC